MTTTLNIAKRARTTGWPAATLTSARYPGADERRVVCLSASNLNRGGQMIPSGGFRPEGLQRKDGRQLQH
jgi:hypothetical protein